MAQSALVSVIPGDLDTQPISAAVLAWSETVIEQPHPVFGGLPICPFARAARLRETIRFHVMPFNLGDPLESAGHLIALIDHFAAEERWDTLFVIHPDPQAFEASALEQFVERLGRRLSTIQHLADLRVFEAHPRSNFCVGGVFTRRSPYPSFQVLSHGRLKEGSDTLLESRYYDRFTPEMFRAVGMPRAS
jgi:hypothetical protein